MKHIAFNVHSIYHGRMVPIAENEIVFSILDVQDLSLTESTIIKTEEDAMSTYTVLAALPKSRPQVMLVPY